MEAIESSIDKNAHAFTRIMPKESSQKSVRAEEKRDLVRRENRQTVGDISVENPRMTCRDVNVYYGENHAIKHVSLDI